MSCAVAGDIPYRGRDHPVPRSLGKGFLTPRQVRGVHTGAENRADVERQKAAQVGDGGVTE